MEPGGRAVRRDARTVEITLAVLIGTAIAAVPNVALWLVGHVAGVGGPGWESAQRLTLLAGVVVAAAVATWWLLRARRRQL